MDVLLIDEFAGNRPVGNSVGSNSDVTGTFSEVEAITGSVGVGSSSWEHGTAAAMAIRVARKMEMRMVCGCRVARQEMRRVWCRGGLRNKRLQSNLPYHWRDAFTIV